ncbi:putative RNA-dependent RNA polymerase [Cryphonectria naterciae splipalmivirus 1]|uniref:RNA-dependent RNA polymerase n=1 Tax=Cryphonectria naterciae splipalmivirus 1 TaxID=2841740 RepID=A0AAD1NUF9_9VIRU|nr:putative RNA-dependent RNA polymerase [Cryphonectria naterciae splipalmivirus 1]
MQDPLEIPAAPRRETGDYSVGEIPTMSSFRLPEGVTRMGSSYFDPDFGLDDVIETYDYTKLNLVEEGNKILQSYGYTPISRDDLLQDHHYISSEVGDDEETASDSKAFIAIQQVFHQLYGMKVSLDDTSINSRFGNFAEDLIILPDGYGQTYLSSRKTGAYLDMSFIDIPKIRLAIDIRPMRMDHSATNDGKAQMIGSRQRWIPLESGFRGQYEVFNLFQDVNLGLIRDRKYPYLPSALGGYGKEPPFRNYENFERFSKAFKQGSHSGLLRNIVRRTNRYISALQRGEYPAKDPLLSHVVRFQSSFHDWVKGRSIYAPVTWYDVPPEVGVYRVAKRGDSPVMDEVIGRLLSEKRLISEQQLEIAVEHNELCKALLKAESIPKFKKLRDEARSRFNNFSIFSMENYGMIKEIILEMEEINLPLSKREISLFHRLVDSTKGTLRVILGEEFVYWPEAMDEIYRTGPMKVLFEFMPLKKFSSERGFAAPSRLYEPDVEDTEEYRELDKLETWLRNKEPRGSPPRAIINDDEPIIASCRKSQWNIIVTDDIKLCREANRRTHNVVVRIPCLWYYLSIYFGVNPYSEYLETKFPGKSFREHLDEGSIKSFEETNFMDGVLLKERKSQMFNIWKNYGEKDRPRIVEEESFNYEPDLPSLVFDLSNVSMTRKVRGRIPLPTPRRPQGRLNR